jgi:hypothetical protein
LSKHVGPWIALAGACVGAGLYFGLRARGHEAAPAAPSGPGSATPVAKRDPAQIQRELEVAFEARRLEWKRACFDPIIAKGPAPARSTHSISISIDASGTEILRAINDVRDGTRFDVATCLREQPFVPIHVAPPGEPYSTTLTLQFP